MKVKRQIIWVGVVIVALVALLSFILVDVAPFEPGDVTATIVRFQTNGGTNISAVVEIRNGSAKTIYHSFRERATIRDCDLWCNRTNGGATQGRAVPAILVDSSGSLADPYMMIPAGKTARWLALPVDSLSRAEMIQMRFETRPLWSKAPGWVIERLPERIAQVREFTVSAKAAESSVK